MKSWGDSYCMKRGNKNFRGTRGESIRGEGEREEKRDKKGLN